MTKTDLKVGDKVITTKGMVATIVSIEDSNRAIIRFGHKEVVMYISQLAKCDKVIPFQVTYHLGDNEQYNIAINFNSHDIVLNKDKSFEDIISNKIRLLIGKRVSIISVQLP